MRFPRRRVLLLGLVPLALAAASLAAQSTGAHRDAFGAVLELGAFVQEVNRDHGDVITLWPSYDRDILELDRRQGKPSPGQMNSYCVYLR